MLPTPLTNMNHHDYCIEDCFLIYTDFIPQTSLFDIVEYSRNDPDFFGIFGILSINQLYLIP